MIGTLQFLKRLSAVKNQICFSNTNHEVLFLPFSLPFARLWALIWRLIGNSNILLSCSGEQKPMEGLGGVRLVCYLTAAYIWPFEVDKMWWIMHSVHCLSEDKTTFGKLLPLTSSQRTRGRSFALSESKVSVRQTRLFLETLWCNASYRGSKFFPF